MEQDRIIRADNAVGQLVPVVMPFLQKALDHAQDEVSDEQLLMGVAASRYQLWLIRDGTKLQGVAVTELVQYPNVKAARVVTLGGEGMSEWLEELVDTLCDFARAEGATRLEAAGRKGLVRVLKPLGFNSPYVVLTKELK